MESPLNFIHLIQGTSMYKNKCSLIKFINNTRKWIACFLMEVFCIKNKIMWILPQSNQLVLSPTPSVRACGLLLNGKQRCSLESVGMDIIESPPLGSFSHWLHFLIFTWDIGGLSAIHLMFFWIVVNNEKVEPSFSC